ncbi:MAG: hypothetical protein AAFR90_14365, partial [Pseudomonadota bacterium]
LIATHACWSIPEMNRLLVEGATHPDCINRLHDELGPAWLSAHQDVLGGELGERLTALAVLIDRTKPFESLSYPKGAEERIRTRLGEDNIRVEIDEPYPIGPFGQQITELVLPGWWCKNIAVDNALISQRAIDGSLLFSIGDNQFRYDRLGLRRGVGDVDGVQSSDRSDHQV